MSQVFCPYLEAQLACSSLTLWYLFISLSIPSQLCLFIARVSDDVMHLHILSCFTFTRLHVYVSLSVGICSLLVVVLMFTTPFYGIATASSYSSTKHSFQSRTNSSTSCPKFTFHENSSLGRCLEYRDDRSMPFKSWFTNSLHARSTDPSFSVRFPANPP